MNVYKEASKTNLKIQSSKGALTVYDLWVLPLTLLDDIAIGLSKQVKQLPNESFIKTVKTSDVITQLKFDIVLDVINTRLEYDARRQEASAKKLQKEKIMEIIESKQDDALQNKSLEELQAMING